MGRINFNSQQAKAKIKKITELTKDAMTSKDVAIAMGIRIAGLRPYIVHLRESGALVEVGRLNIRCGGTEVQYKSTGKYFPIIQDFDDAPRTSDVKPFRDALTVAFFGEARA